METIDRLLSSKEFTNLVNEISNSFGVAYNDDIKNDVRQICAIAAWEAFQKYDPEKVGGNFWGYAHLRMREYAKREIYKIRNTVHIPMNKTTEWETWSKKNGKTFEAVSHSYEALTWDDGHDRFANDTNDVALRIDIAAALDILDPESRYIVEVYSEIKHGTTETKRPSFSSISKDLNIPTHVVKEKFAMAQQTIAAFLGR